ncbi:MAG: 3-deoxy-7-phosphoheptulonate synthase [Clostridia bacterium]|nr:3-deoxy-7-phosphoheptulonate synthase [Clostridia bacterium]MBR5767635.1 3-deoxy-7-phosphoheptulonate synthase [Clostridia bacterium]
MDMIFERKLAVPAEVKEMYPLTAELAEIVKKRDAELKSILSGSEDRLILVIGPCSADREDSVIDYITRLRGLQEKVSDKIFIIPRIYTNKPRTTGDGYKGMLHQPDPNEKPDMFKGIVAIRELHMRALRETGFSCADEMLYPENHKYLDDMLCYVAVGARSVENQQHRLTASGVGIPVGMKNPTSGDLSIMMNAITAAQHKHTFIYRGWEVHSNGNPYSHAILRGYVNKHGQTMPNYHYEDLMFLCDLYAKREDLTNPAVLIDTNHSNSGKQFAAQPRIAKEVMHSRIESPDLKKLIKGFMIESYIEDDCQKIGDGVYGKSITDPCLGWEKTERLILDLAELCR